MKIWQEFEQSELLGSIVFMLLFISFTFNIFMFCYIGDLLTEKVTIIRLSHFVPYLFRKIILVFIYDSTEAII